MEKSRRRAATNRGMEENTMAILDSYASRDSSHQNADRIAFLDAVRSASIVPQHGPPPTYMMFEAIFGICRDTTSLELLIASYQLLTELEKRFPRVYLLGETKPIELIIIEEAWSPFSFATESPTREKNTAKGNSVGPLNSSDFHLLIEEVLNQLDAEEDICSIDLLRNMFVFQYLVCVLDGDFRPRNSAFLDTSNWNSLRESILNLLVGSRQINYKVFVEKCMFIVSTPFPTHAIKICDVEEAGSAANEALTFALPEVGRSTQKAANKLLVMLMELDSSRNNADLKGLMTRGDGVRTPTMEIIVDQLTYQKDFIDSFLEAFDEPKLKLEIVLQYFRKYIAKPTVRTRRSTESVDDATIAGVLKGLANPSISKNTIKKIGAGVIQLLLAHTLQACLALPEHELLKVISNSKDEVPSSSPLKELSNNITSAFKSIRSIDQSIEIIPLGKEALFAAATILAT